VGDGRLLHHDRNGRQTRPKILYQKKKNENSDTKTPGRKVEGLGDIETGRGGGWTQKSRWSGYEPMWCRGVGGVLGGGTRWVVIRTVGRGVRTRGSSGKRGETIGGPRRGVSAVRLRRVSQRRLCVDQGGFRSVGGQEKSD